MQFHAVVDGMNALHVDYSDGNSSTRDMYEIAEKGEGRCWFWGS